MARVVVRWMRGFEWWCFMDVIIGVLDQVLCAWGWIMALCVPFLEARLLETKRWGVVTVFMNVVRVVDRVFCLWLVFS